MNIISPMDQLSQIAERIHQNFETLTRVRDQALVQSRQVVVHAAHAIRAIHREDHDLAYKNLDEARSLVNNLCSSLGAHPSLYHTGYTQDAIKEFVEASITCALIENLPLPAPEELDVEYATYLNGLAEVSGELRRRSLDVMRQNRLDEAQRLLNCMDDIYAVLVTMDYPDAITYGLRRQTDLVRGILERTRGDLTISQREEQLKQSLETFMALLEHKH
jgi:translin